METAQTDPVGILIAEDHRIVRQELKRHLAADPRLRVVAEAADGTRAVELALLPAVEVVLMDLRMPGLDSMEAIRRIKAARPGVAVLVLSVHADLRHLREARTAGADGYLLKGESASKLAGAVVEARAGKGAFIQVGDGLPDPDA